MGIMTMPRYDIFERDGATFRRPHGRDVPIVDDVWHGDRWVPYQGDRSKPAMFGDFIGVEEYDDEVALRNEDCGIAAKERLAARDAARKLAEEE
jgi:hypothetical protein